MAVLAVSSRPPPPLVFVLHLTFSQPHSPENQEQLIKRTGDAQFTPDTLDLTRNRRDRNSIDSTGRAQYIEPVPLWDRASGEMASFTTTFRFKITPDPDAQFPGDGLAFFLGHFQSAIPNNSWGGQLGLLPAGTNGTGDSTIVAVEFDTALNTEHADISGNHIGIDVNSLNSTASTDIPWPGSKLTSGSPLVATVRYENVTQVLAVDLMINETSYHVNTTVDLRSYLPEDVAVGFSSATGWGREQHQVLAWSFSSTLQHPTIAPAGPPPQSKKSGGILIPVLVPLLSLLACAAVGLFVLWQRRRRSRRRAADEPSDDSDYEEQENRAELERGVAASGPRRYSYRELVAATGNFAEGHKLGRGGFGSVYRGTLVVSGQEERAVAIKMLSSESSAQGRKEFEAEVRIISRLKHRNLLVARGSLDRHLHSRDTLLTWPERFQIILGLGSALRYLHQEWEQCVVHGDIKPSNIMLDEALGAKLGDFGLARLVDHGATSHTTKAVLGTAGYIDPEFINTRHPSAEADVYSFGVLLLEVVSGRAPVILPPGGGPPFTLLKWVWGLYARDATLDAADERLRGGGEDDDRCMERALVVGLWCAHPDPSERPSIAKAVHVLQSRDASLPELPRQMYKTASDVAFAGGAFGAMSIESYSGVSSSTMTGHSKVSSDSSSTALLRDSKELA
ncbi:hypothetical protein ACP4OV_017395 [Aristida adscensionis]